MRQFADFSSHNARRIDHFGFMYHGDLAALWDELLAKGVTFPVELKRGVAAACGAMLPPPMASASS
jgi:hypothetical protein